MLILAAAVLIIFAGMIRGAAARARRKRFPYAAKTVMSEPEQVLYFRIVAALPDHLVLAQVQMSSFLKLAGRQRDWQTLSSRIRQKSVDFLLLRKDAFPIAAIELQDASHKRPDRAESDEFKRRALAAAGLPLIEFHVSDLPAPGVIRHSVLAAVKNA